ncbi:class I SAM-dependent methyltransferase [Candidatus Woesearchaeota archaeon]|nr:class I SAM-dependent methyltransferase [Candidatus Woesearchaeota archaeon]
MAFNRKLGQSYKKVGESYHIGRRDYPKKLIEDIIKISNLNKESLILDMGCGTGKSTIPFAKRGYRIIGIDISEDMLKVAKNLSTNYKTAKYKTVSFEKFHSLNDSFDLILAASAIHWVHPEIAYKKIAKMLKKEGHIAIFWRLIDQDSSKFLLKIRGLFTKHCPGYYHYAPSKIRAKKSVNDVVQRLVKSEKFAKTLVKKYTSLEMFTKEEYINLVNSYSWVASLKEKKKELLIHELNEILDKEIKPIRIREKFYLMISKKKQLKIKLISGKK